MLTVQRFTQLEVWSALQCDGGTRLGVIEQASACSASVNLDGDDRLTIAIGLQSSVLALLIGGAIIRVVGTDENSAATFDEWVISEDGTATGDGTVTITALAAETVLGECALVGQQDGVGGVLYDFELIGLSPAQMLSTAILPVLVAEGMSWVAAGTLDSSIALDVVAAWDSPLALVRRIAAKAGLEFQFRRVGTTGYAIDLVSAIGSAATTADFRTEKNLGDFGRTRSRGEQATRVYPQGAAADGIKATMARAVWTVDSAIGQVVALSDPVGGDGPILFDTQLVSTYVRSPSGTLFRVSASSALANSVTLVGGHGLVPGDRVQFRKDSSGADLTYLESPADVALYGVIAKALPQPDVTSTFNIVPNAACRAWPSGTLPTSWSLVGLPTTSKQTAGPYVRTGPNTIRVQATADGAGVITTQARIDSTSAAPYLSGFVSFWLVSGRVRVEIIITKNDLSTVVVPLSPSVASSGVLGQWVDLGVSGTEVYDLTGATAAIRIVQDGATAAEFYVDAAQLSNTATQQPFIEGSGGTQLWQAANEKLRTGGAPAQTIALSLVDLARVNPSAYADDCSVLLGGTARLTETRVAIAITTRVVGVTRNYLDSGDTSITFSTKADDLTGTLARPKRPPRLVPTMPTFESGLTPQFCRVLAKMTAATDTTFTVTVTSSATGTSALPQVRLSTLVGTTLVSGPAVGVAASSGQSWVFNRPALAAPSASALFEAFATGYVTDADPIEIPEQGRDTVAVKIEATITATTATQCTVSVTATDPADVTNSVTIAVVDATGTSAPTPSSVSAAGTVTQSYTVARPAFGNGSARVLWRASASGRVSDADAIDVPPQDRDTLYALCSARVISSTATAVTVQVDATALVGTPTVQLVDTVNATRTAGAVAGTPSASGSQWTFARNAFQSGTGQARFRAVLSGYENGDALVAIEEQGRDTLYTQCSARIISSTASDVTVQVDASALVGTPTVQLVDVVNTTRTAGATAGTPAASGSQWTFSRNAFQSGSGQVRFRAVLAGYENDDDLVTIEEQGRDTIPLLVRLKVQSSTSTQIVVRVYVSDPYPQGANTVTVSYVGLGVPSVSPASGQTLTPTNDIDTTGYVEFTIDRPAYLTGTGHVTFKAVASNRTNDADDIGIPAIDALSSLLMSVEQIGEDSTTMTFRVRAGDTVPQGTNSITLSYQARGVGTITPASGGFTGPVSADLTNYVDVVIARPSTGSIPGSVTFFLQAANRVPVSQNASISAPLFAGSVSITSLSADASTDVVDVSWSSSGMPVGTTFDVYYTHDGHGTYSNTNVTSPDSMIMPDGINPSDHGSVEVRAMNAGACIGTTSDDWGTFDVR